METKIAAYVVDENSMNFTCYYAYENEIGDKSSARIYGVLNLIKL